MAEKKYDAIEDYTVFTFNPYLVGKNTLLESIHPVKDTYYIKVRVDAIKDNKLYPICFIDESYLAFTNHPYICNNEVVSVKALLGENNKLNLIFNLHDSSDRYNTKVILYIYTREGHKQGSFNFNHIKEESNFVGYVNPRVSSD